MTVRTNNEMIPSFTVISNDFIDNYMASANGEYVKVYLYVLRAGGDASCDEIADALEMTATDAARAVNYWSRRGLLSTHDDDAEGDAAAEMKLGAKSDVKPDVKSDMKSAPEKKQPQQPLQSEQRPQARQEEEASETDLSRSGEAQGSIDIEKLRDDEDFAGLLYSLQQYLGKPFGQKDVESLGYMYDTLHISVEMIEYLAEVSVKRGRPTTNYMESIARDWVKKNITTLEEAKAETSRYGSQVWTVMKGFGLNDRKPVDVELEYIGKWFGTYAFSEDMVKEAISRTMDAIHKPSFQYADSILEKWHTAGVHRIDEIQGLDREHEKRSKAQAAGYAKPRATGFSNFTQRDADLDSNMLAMLKDKL